MDDNKTKKWIWAKKPKFFKAKNLGLLRMLFNFGARQAFIN